MTIDNRNIPQEAYENQLLGNMVLRVRLNNGEHVSQVHINGKPIAAYCEDAGYGFIYLPPLRREVYSLQYPLGNNLMEAFVNNTGTYNVYEARLDGRRLAVDLKMYGTQVVRLKSAKPALAVQSSNPALGALSNEYHQNNQ